MTLRPSGIVQAAWAAGALLAAADACAQNPSAGPGQSFPQRPVRLIVPFAPGGTTDIVARGVAQRLSTLWGQQVVADNRPGGGTLLGAEIVANAAPDGHTLLMVGTSTIINTGTSFAPPSNRIDVERDFSSIILCATGANVVSVRANAPYRNLQELIAATKAKPTSLTYGTSGVGSSNHFSGELLMLMAGIQLVHVPYKGNAPALTDAVGGQIDMVFAGAAAVQTLVKAGRLRALAIGSKQRFVLLPDVPTFDEAGLPGYEMPNFFGFGAPAGTPRTVVAKINRDTETLLKQPEIIQQLLNDGLTARGGTPEDFVQFIRERKMQLVRLIKAANIRPQ